MSRTVNLVTDEEKLRIVSLYLEGGISQQELSRQVGVAPSSVSKWVTCYTTNGTFCRYTDVKDTGKKTNAPMVDARDAEIARLRAALERAELHVHALETMIDVAEESLNIKIRKKAGAKQ